jgi:GABA permease
MAHILVIANETAASATLLDAVREEAAGGDLAGEPRVTVVAPVNEPKQGYVVYEDTRRASAGRRLDKTLRALRTAGIAAQGFVVETGPVQAVKDALAQLEPPVDEIVVSTHPPQRSGWMRRDVVAEIERGAQGLPVKHVIADPASESGETNVLVIANQTVLSEELLDRIRKRAGRGPASFLIVAPQGDDEEHPEADRRLRRALTELRGEGIEAHGQVVHPDPYTAAINAVHDERVDEIIVSTFPGERSGWLRRDLVQRLRKDTQLPVDHVISTSTGTVGSRP